MKGKFMTNNNGRTLQRSDASKELRTDVEKMQNEWAKSLPPNVDPKKFVRIVLNTVMSNPDFLKCDRKSLFAAASKCAADGLFPDNREATMIPYGNTVQYQPMIGGIYKKIRNSGEIAILCADLVYPGDFFDYGTSSEKGRYLEHKPKLGEPREVKDVTAVFALAKTKDGYVDFEPMTKQEVEFVRSKSKAPNSPAWREWWGEMAKKTVIKRLSKRLPMSEVQNLIDHDNEEDDVTTNYTKSKVDELSNKLEAEAIVLEADSFGDFDESSSISSAAEELKTTG